MKPQGSAGSEHRHIRRDLLRQYVRLQRNLIEGDPASSAYQATVQAFRQMGYALINCGFEDDLDRLLRIRVLEGGRAVPSTYDERTFPQELHVIENQVTR